MSAIAGLVLLPLTAVAGTLVLRPGGLVFTKPLLPFELLKAAPSSDHAVRAFQWVVPPREVLLALDLERLVAAFIASAFIIGALQLVFGPSPRLRDRSPPTQPGAWALGAVAFHVTAMRVLALPTVDNYGEGKDAAALMCCTIGVLLSVREMGSLSDRISESVNQRIRTPTQAARIALGCGRMFLALAMVRRAVMKPLQPY